MPKNNYEPLPDADSLKLDVRLQYVPPKWASMPGMLVTEKRQETLDTKVQ